MFGHRPSNVHVFTSLLTSLLSHLFPFYPRDLYNKNFNFRARLAVKASSFTAFQFATPSSYRYRTSTVQPNDALDPPDDRTAPALLEFSHIARERLTDSRITIVHCISRLSKEVSFEFDLAAFTTYGTRAMD